MKGVRVDPERRETRLLSKQVSFSGARVLDIGAGDGRLSNRIKGWVHSIVGLDLEGKDLQRAHDQKRLNHVAKFVVADGARLPFQEYSFDLALFSWSL